MTTLSDNIIYRRVSPLLAVFTLVLALVGLGWTFANDRSQAANDRRDRARDQARILDNTANAITSCQNANESRAASRTLWYFVVDLASKDAPPTRAAYLAEVRDWIGTVYQPHDCNDLGRQYVIPPPPAIPGR